MARQNRASLFVLAILGPSACAFSADRGTSSPHRSSDTMGVTVDARGIHTRLRRDLEEASAAVMSRAQPGLFWSLNDSGHEPMLFALDTAGRQRGAWRVEGAQNIDWEAASLGSCGNLRGTHCLYIGDVGDNGARRPAVTVYRVVEMLAGNAARTGATPPAQALTFRYPDHAHDVEAMYVARNGTMYFITKRPLRDSTGGLRRALVFGLPASAWSVRDSSPHAALIDSLPIVPGSATGLMITDAALAPDGRHLAVRTYRQVYVFATDPETGRIQANIPPSVCDLDRLGERQGEAVTWLGARGRLLLMSEGRNEPLYAIDCPTPPRRAK